MSILSIESTTRLNNGTHMPWLGLGVFESREGGELEQAIAWALDAGYRSFDTASLYGNERGVGKALQDSGIARDQLFVTTKIWNDDVRSGQVQQAFDISMEKLGLEYVDLYLIHWPVPGHYLQAWKELENIYRSGRAKAIGVSNFMQHHLQDIMANSDMVPAVNQVEYHPLLPQPNLVQFCEQHDIRFQAWSPLMRGKALNLPVVQEIANRHTKTPAQVVLRWDLQHGVITIPKSIRQERIRENADIFDFELSADDMFRLDNMGRIQRDGPDPNNFGF